MHGRSRILFFPLFFHEKVTKNQSKKCEKQGPTEKTRKVGSWGRLFLAQCRTFDVFGVPGASPGEALGRILGNKFRGEKIDEKKVWKALASAGEADPGQDSLAGFLKEGSSTPSLPRVPVGGRIQCAAHRPPRAGVVMQRVVMHDSSFGRLIRIRFCRNHVKTSGSRRKN